MKESIEGAIEEFLLENSLCYDDLIDYCSRKKQEAIESVLEEDTTIASRVFLLPYARGIQTGEKEDCKFCELFFHAVDIQHSENNQIKSFKAQCILCGSVVDPFGNRENKSGANKYRSYSLTNHLISVHRGSDKQMEVAFQRMEYLKEYRRESSGVPSVDSFFKRRRMTSEGVSQPVANSPTPELVVPVAGFASSQPGAYLGPGYESISVTDVMGTMRIVLSNHALSWDKHWSMGREYWEGFIAPYRVTQRTVPLIYGNVKAMVRGIIPCFSRYSLSCDCWSTNNNELKAICWFIHAFHNGKYRSILLDCHPIEDSTARSLENSLKRVRDFYQLDEDVYITTDNASSNVSAFGNHRFRCMAHALNTACSHLTSDTRQDTSTYGLKVKERKKVREYFKTVDTVCSVFRTKSSITELTDWYEEKKSLMTDIQVSIRAPLEPCETRWIEQINNLKWLRKFGVLVYRYLLCGHNHIIDIHQYHSCLVQLPEVLVLINILNNAINLLAPEDEGSFHLVLPVLFKLKVLFNRFEPKGDIASLIKQSLMYELNSGCLVIPEENLLLYKCASACFPRLKEDMSGNI